MVVGKIAYPLSSRTLIGTVFGEIKLFYLILFAFFEWISGGMSGVILVLIK